MRSTWMVAMAALVLWSMGPVVPAGPASAQLAPPLDRLLLSGQAGPAVVQSDGTGLRSVSAVGVSSASGQLQAEDNSLGGHLVLRFGDGSCPRRIEHPDVRGLDPGAFSPDEATLAVSSYQAAARYPVDFKVELLDVATGRRTVLTPGRNPSWSPDGSSLAYDSSTTFLATPPENLHTIRRDGTGKRDLGVKGDGPQWSPDGTRLAYARSGGLWVMDLETGMERLVAGPASASLVRWAGDGSGLYFTVRDTAIENGIWVVDADGGSPQRLAAGDRLLIDVIRSPDARHPSRYRTVSGQGSVRTFGPGCGPSGSAATAGSGLVGAAGAADGLGVWTVTGTGRVAATGQAATFGDTAGVPLQRPVVDIAGTPTDRGYWLVAGDGGIFGFGDSRFYGSTGGIRLNRPVVGMASTPSGNGYWLVASDGGIFAFGDARFFGSTGGIRLNRPVVGMVASPTGNGYLLVASDGGIFGFGDARFHGSTGGIRLNRPVVGMASTPTGSGYWLAADDGGIFPFGDAGFGGSAVGTGAGPIVDVVG